MLITSTKNDAVRQMRRLKDRSERRESGLHLIEGERLVFDALKSGAVAKEIYIEDGRDDLAARVTSLGLEYTGVSRNVLEAMADTSTPQGIVACMHTPKSAPPEEYSAGLIVALDALQDPGNLGTILRTADAMGATCILLGEGCTDAFSPKALRAAVGSTYHLPIYNCDLKAELERLIGAGFQAVCGHLDGVEELPRVGDRCVLVIGNEGNGVSDEIAEMCMLCRLPMYGRAESLNASVAASLLMYELSKTMHGR